MRWMWIDRIVELVPRQRMVAIKNVSLAEDHLHDHFPARPGRAALPVMPASLIIEGMAQTAGILVGHAEGFREKVILAKVGNAEIERDAAPGSTLRYTATVQHLDAQGASTLGTIELLDYGDPAPAFRPIGRVELMFSHIDRTMGVGGSTIELPEHNFVFGDSFRTLLRMSGIEA